MRTDNRWSVRTSEWIPRDGKRGRGWQRVRGSDEINEFARTNWNQLVQDRMRWRLLVDALFLKWTKDRLIKMIMMTTMICTTDHARRDTAIQMHVACRCMVHLDCDRKLNAKPNEVQ